MGFKIRIIYFSFFLLLCFFATFVVLYTKESWNAPLLGVVFLLNSLLFMSYSDKKDEIKNKKK